MIRFKELRDEVYGWEQHSEGEYTRNDSEDDVTAMTSRQSQVLPMVSPPPTEEKNPNISMAPAVADESYSLESLLPSSSRMDEQDESLKESHVRDSVASEVSVDSGSEELRNHSLSSSSSSARRSAGLFGATFLHLPVPTIFFLHTYVP